MSELDDKPWSHIVYLDKWELGTPEIEPEMRSLEQWCLNKNVKYTAIVFAPSAIKIFQLEKMLKGRESENYRHFDSKDDAMKWLRSNQVDV